MQLYHFTSGWRLPEIVNCGVIKTTESNVGSPTRTLPPYGTGAGPDVVWLLDSPQLNGYSHGLLGGPSDKTSAFIAVDIPAFRWVDWAWTAKMNPKWKEVLIQAGGGQRAAEQWYVWPRPILQDRWCGIWARWTPEEGPR